MKRLNKNKESLCLSLLQTYSLEGEASRTYQ